MPDAVLFIGPEPLRRARARNLAAGRRVTVDCTEQPDLLAELLAANGGLFPIDVIHARNMSALTLAAIREVNTLLHETTVLLVGESDTFPVGHERALVNATVTRLAGRPGTLPSEYRQIAGLLGTHITAADAAFLDGRTGGDPASAVSVLEAGAAAGLPTIDRQLIETLATGPEGPGLPWLLLEALDRRDARKTLEELSRCETIPTIAYAVKRWTCAALAAEGRDQREIEGLLGGKVSDSAMAAARRIVSTTTPVVRGRVLSRLAAADLHAKTGNPEAGLALAVATLDEASNPM